MKKFEIEKIGTLDKSSIILWAQFWENPQFM